MPRMSTNAGVDPPGLVKGKFMRVAAAVVGLVLLCACATPKPAETATAAKPADAKPAAAAQPAATQTAAAKQDCRRVKELGSIKYKEECRTRSESAADTKAGRESRDAAARAIQSATSLGN